MRGCHVSGRDADWIERFGLALLAGRSLRAFVVVNHLGFCSALNALSSSRPVSSSGASARRPFFGPSPRAGFDPKKFGAIHDRCVADDGEVERDVMPFPLPNQRALPGVPKIDT